MKARLAFLFCFFVFVGSLAAQSVSTNKTAYLVLEPIVVTFSGLSGDASDYITIVPYNSPDALYNEWYGSGGKVSGTMNFRPQEPGDYEARVHLRNAAAVSARARFTVSYPNPTIATDKAAYLVLEQFTVTYSNLPGYTNDYITIVPYNAPDSTYHEWYNTNGNKSGTMKFTRQLDPGTYEARLHFRNEDTVRARARFTISFPASTIATNKASYAVGEPITVTYSNLPGYPNDYITVVPYNAADNIYHEWYNTLGVKNGTMTFTRKLDPGTYEARLHYRNEEPIVRARARFGVGTTACSFALAATSPVSFGAGGGSGTASVTAGAGCAWNATSAVTWITTTSSGTGDGTVNYTVAANTGTSSRTGAVAVSDQTLTVTQAGAGGGGTPPAAGNLVQNWDAEAGPADPGYNGLRTIPGWTADGKVTVYRYDNTAGFPNASTPGPANRGNNFFGGGYSGSSRITQLIDLSASASAIDSGGQPYTLSAWLGGYENQVDNAALRVTFRSSSGGSVLGTGSVGPVTPADRAGVTALLERTTAGMVPSGARIAELSLEFTHAEGSANDGYADNLYFGLVGGGGTPSTGGKCGGTCGVSPPGQTIGASGGTGSIAVTASSSWDAVAVDNWITITSGGSGNGNGTVGFTVSANTGPPRSGTILVAGQTCWVHQSGTPSGTTAGCNYLVQSSNVQNVPVGGTTSGLIQVVTAQTCSWTATKSASWITIRSGAAVTGNGAVAYTVSANDTGSPRSSPIVIAGQVVAINQAGGALPVPPGTPSVSAGGVVNTASYAPGGPPDGSLAQGSFFSIYGSDLGPDEFAKASSYPLPRTLGGVGVQIKQGSNTYDAYLVFSSKGQINAVLPSNVPIGDAQITVNYNGKTSAPANIRIAKTSFGLFFQRENGKDLAIAQNVASATDYPRNLPDTPAKPGQIVILWGTGLGPIGGADNGAPGASAGDMTGVPVTITVGGVAAQRLYAGRQPETAAVDNIYFTVPAGVPYGCQVPVAITAGGAAANTTLIAITANGAPCQ